MPVSHACGELIADIGGAVELFLAEITAPDLPEDEREIATVLRAAAEQFHAGDPATALFWLHQMAACALMLADQRDAAAMSNLISKFRLWTSRLAGRS